jgi:hypothetical protein
MSNYCYLCSDDADNIPFPPADNNYISIHHLCFRTFMSSIGISDLGRILSIESNKSSNYYLELYDIVHDIFLYIPKESQKKYMCYKFISYNSEYLEYVREDLKSLDFSLTPENNDFLEQRTQIYPMQDECYLCDLSYNLIEISPSENDFINIQYKCFKNFFLNRCLDYNNKTYQHYLESFISRKHIFPMIPSQFQNDYICNIAISNHGRFIEYVREDLKTLDICLKAVQTFPPAYKYIPSHLKTPENNNLFLEQNKKVAYFISKYP